MPLCSFSKLENNLTSLTTEIAAKGNLIDDKQKASTNVYTCIFEGSKQLTLKCF